MFNRYKMEKTRDKVSSNFVINKSRNEYNPRKNERKNNESKVLVANELGKQYLNKEMASIYANIGRFI